MNVRYLAADSSAIPRYSGCAPSAGATTYWGWSNRRGRGSSALPPRDVRLPRPHDKGRYRSRPRDRRREWTDSRPARCAEECRDAPDRLLSRRQIRHRRSRHARRAMPNSLSFRGSPCLERRIPAGAGASVSRRRRRCRCRAFMDAGERSGVRRRCTDSLHWRRQNPKASNCRTGRGQH